MNVQMCMYKMQTFLHCTLWFREVYMVTQPKTFVKQKYTMAAKKPLPFQC